MSYGRKLCASFGASALTVTALAGCVAYFHEEEKPRPAAVNLNQSPAQNFTSLSSPPPQEILAQNAENGEIEASEFVMSADDMELASFEEENGFSFDSTADFTNEMEDEFKLGSDFAVADQVGNKPDASIERNGKMSANEAYEMAERTIGIPANLLKKIVNNESLGDPKAVNSSTGACGLGQLMPETTLPEMAYKYSETLGFDLHTKIDRYIVGRTSGGLNVIGYRPHRGERTNLRRECLDEWVNVSLFSMNIVEKMRRINNALADRGRRVSYVETDIYIAHFLGARDDIIWARRNNPDALAKNFVNNRIIRDNRHMFFDRQGNPRSIAGMYAYAEKDGAGPNEKTRVTPFWRISSATIASRVDRALTAG